MGEPLAKIKGRCAGLSAGANDRFVAFVTTAEGESLRMDRPLSDLERWVDLIQRRAQIEITISEAPHG